MKNTDIAILEKAARMLKAVAHPARIGAIKLLVKHGKLSVGDLQQKLGLSQSMTSQHLSALRRIEVVGYEKQANVCYYFIQNKNILKLLECVERCAGSRSV